MSCAQLGSHRCVIFFLVLVNCWTPVAELFGEAVLVGVAVYCRLPLTAILMSVCSGVVEPEFRDPWVTHLCNKFWGIVPRWWHIINLSWTEFSKGTALGWVLLCPFWISDVTQLSYPVLVIWMRDDSKLLKTDIFHSQLPMSRAGTNVPELCDWLLLCPAALGVFCLNVLGGKQSAIKCNGNLSQLWYLLLSPQCDVAEKKKLHSTVFIHEGLY